MSPSRRTVRQLATLLIPLLLVAGVLAVLAVPASGQGNNTTTTAPSTTSGRVFNIAPIEDATKCPKGEGPCWDVPLLVVAPGDTVTVNVDLTHATVPHDFSIKLPDGSTKKTKTTVGSVESFTFTFPENAKTLDFFCSVHPKTMIGKVGIASALTSAPAEGSDIPELGVHFLSYWVGLIAFMLLFVVYGFTFFLFKYNETGATTDQWERAGAGAPEFKRRFSPGGASILAILIAAVVIAALIFFARR